MSLRINASQVGRFVLLPVLYLNESFAFGAGGGTAAPDPFTEKTLIALISAVLSLITGYVLLQITHRKDPHKRLSYSLERRHGVFSADDKIARHVCLTYKGRPADNITFVHCDVRNTGNTVIKRQFLRFDFGDGTRVLDAYADPPPPKEYGLEEVKDDDLQFYEKRFLIQHLEKDQKINFRFVLSQAQEHGVQIFPYNEEGDVALATDSVSHAADDKKKVQQFVFYWLLLLIVPPIFRFAPGYISDLAVTLVHLILAAALLPLFKPIARIVSSVVVALAQPAAPSISVGSVMGSELSVVTGGELSITRSGQEDHKASAAGA